jgi:peptidoglycan hydrolase-like protein with peptidoglycan-binding domain
MEQTMKKFLITGVTLVSLAALLPASAQQVNAPNQPANRPPVAQQNNNAAQPSRDEIMRAQQALDQKGFHAGRADGVLGPRTKQALNRFQQQQGLQQTGQLDNRTLSALGLSQRPATTGQAGTNMAQPSSRMSK